MEYRRLGRLEHRSSVLVYGAAALGEVTQEVAEASVREALAGGINHLDVAASYGDAELRLGPLMGEIRDSVFLATKTGERDEKAAWAQINESLTRLQTDHVDLLQLHAVTSYEELDAITAPDGALAAAVRAQDEGLVRAVGITGHGPIAAAVHLAGLQRFPFATVLTPLNAALWRDPAWRDDYQALVAEVQHQDAGLMTIKTLARRNYPPGMAPTHATWYEPLVDDDRVRAATSWVLAHEEIAALATSGDVRLLGPLLRAEADRMPLVEAEQILAELPDYSSPFLDMPA